MRKIYEHADYAVIRYYQSILEDEGILTLVKNVGAAMGTGEIPFTEVYPELWVMNDSDYDRAEAMLAPLHHQGPPEATFLPVWTCASCGETVDGDFGECWNCGTERPPIP